MITGVTPQSVEEAGIMHVQNTGWFEIEGQKEGGGEGNKPDEVPPLPDCERFEDPWRQTLSLTQLKT